jgi:hypothetical protein
MRRPTAAVPLLVLALSACGEDGVVACDRPDDTSAERLFAAPFSVLVTVVDSATGNNIAATATGAFVTGTVADSLRHDFPTLLAAYGPAGRYSLVVQHPGYASWGTTRVQVGTDECGIEPATVTARLRRVEAQ